MKEDAPQREHSPRAVFNAVRYIVRAGCPWRMIPNETGERHKPRFLTVESVSTSGFITVQTACERFGVLLKTAATRMCVFSRLFTTVFAFALAVSAACAGHEVADGKSEVSVFNPFEKGTRELQIGAGAFFSLHNRSEQRPTNNDADLSVRLGWMISTPDGDGFFRGNHELLVEAFGAFVFQGPGDGLGGLTLFLRRNFVQPDSRIVPYLQFGAGVLLNDIHDDPRQRRVGQAFEFSLQGGLGVRYLCSERCAVFLEGTYCHISNANLSDRNFGLNSWGGLLGASYFF